VGVEWGRLKLMVMTKRLLCDSDCDFGGRMINNNDLSNGQQYNRKKSVRPPSDAIRRRSKKQIDSKIKNRKRVKRRETNLTGGSPRSEQKNNLCQH